MYQYAVLCKFPDKITYGIDLNHKLTNRMAWLTLYEALDILSSIKAPDDVVVTIYQGVK